MHPGFVYWWKLRHGGRDGAAWAGCAVDDRGDGVAGAEWLRRHRERDGERHRHRRDFGRGDDSADPGGNAFGVRRPLLWLAFKLDLSDEQIEELARILDDLKTERAQAEVDRRRTVAAFADALVSEAFDATRAGEGGDLRVDSARRLRDAVLQGLSRLHAVLEPPQRSRLAYLIRTGALQI